MAKVKFREISPELRTLAAPDINNENKRFSVGNERVIGELHYIKPEYLIPYSKQSRTLFNDEGLNELARSIESVGVRQPLAIIKSSTEDKFEIVSGERRFRAAKIAGLQRIPCIIIKDASLAEEIALIENIHRKDLHPLELAKAYQQLIDSKEEFSLNDLGKKIGVAKSTISEILKLLTLPISVQNKLLEKSIDDRQTLRSIFNSTSEQEMLSKLELPRQVRKILSGSTKRKKVLEIKLDQGQAVIEYKKQFLNEEQKEEIRKQLDKFLIALDI